MRDFIQVSAIAAALTLVGGCGIDAPAGSDEVGCEGKCDGRNDSTLLRLAIARDVSTSDEFFRADTFTARYTPPALEGLVRGATLNFWTADHDGGGELLDRRPNEEIVLRRVATDDYPITARIDFHLDDSMLGSAALRTLSMPLTFTRADVDAGRAAREVALPFDVWSVEIETQLPSAAGTLTPYDVALGDLRALDASTVRLEHVSFFATPTRAASLHLVVPRGTTELSGQLRADGPDGSVLTPFGITGPGRYVVTSSGLARAPEAPSPTTPDPANPDPANPDPTNPEPANPDPANPDPANPDPANPDPANPAPAVCEPGCSSWQVCVRAACVSRDAQRSGATCDEDSHCASDAYACVDHTCRYLDDQRSGATCEADRHCASSAYACVRGVCRYLEDQRSGAVCEADPHCASSAYACVESACRYLEDQRSGAVCEQDRHCASSAYACVQSACRYLDEQRNGAVCIEDRHCAPGYRCNTGSCTWAG